ncbi:MAG TPA: folylpolyglutamate synthase/dihydrofolate synthase family protein [Candidatus Polarisedimenticolia bacterium]|jgi:dihydrofolate synthase/folylpolyglutamate synthase|nr:folylpolyglutamate synthase/dihydrofolate synthase family protein [Candidatus Polarisedimenticolia bacterium]
MNYSESLDYLFALQRLGARPGTQVVSTLLARLGDPQNSFPSILIAGTNGKGSTAAFLASMLRCAGLKTGLYTSPHLVQFEERITVNGEMIAPTSVARLATVIQEHVEQMGARGGDLERPTFFESTTAMAFRHFQDVDVDVAVLEVGMGGRLDATNVVDAVTCLFTPIDLDHRQHLGEDVATIAWEKAGILKSGSRAITAPQSPEVMEVLLRASAVRGATLLEAEGIWRIAERAQGTMTLISGVDSSHRMENLVLSLAGRHQRTNAALAVAAASRLPNLHEKITEEAIRRGLAETRWPGRCEIAGEQPTILLDGAHNPASARALRRFLLENYKSQGRKVVMVFGAMMDKDLDGIMEALFPCAQRIVLTRAETPRAADPVVLESVARRHHDSVIRAPGLSAALSAAKAEAGPSGVVCVTGSLYLVGDVKTLLEGGEPRSRQAL